MPVLELVFVGQCEVFVCLDFVLFSSFFSLLGLRTESQFFKKCQFFRHLLPESVEDLCGTFPKT